MGVDDAIWVGEGPEVTFDAEEDDGDVGGGGEEGLVDGFEPLRFVELEKRRGDCMRWERGHAVGTVVLNMR